MFLHLLINVQTELYSYHMSLRDWAIPISEVIIPTIPMRIASPAGFLR